MLTIEIVFFFSPYILHSFVLRYAIHLTLFLCHDLMPSWKNGKKSTVKQCALCNNNRYFTFTIHRSEQSKKSKIFIISKHSAIFIFICNINVARLTVSSILTNSAFFYSFISIFNFNHFRGTQFRVFSFNYNKIKNLKQSERNFFSVHLYRNI